MASREFASTQWSLILAAGDRSSSQGAAAFASLCRLYWRPLYAYVRRRGSSVEDARDLTQSFFARLMEKNSIGLARRERGRFRTFLLTSLQNFLSNEWDRDHALKRGGGNEFLSIEDFRGAENEYLLDRSAKELPPDKLYERKWTLALLDRATARLASEFAAAGKSSTFEALRGFLAGDGGGPAYTEIAATLGIGEVAARVAVHRLRGRLRDVLRMEIADTVAEPDNPDAIQEELRSMLAAL